MMVVVLTVSSKVSRTPPPPPECSHFSPKHSKIFMDLAGSFWCPFPGSATFLTNAVICENCPYDTSRSDSECSASETCTTCSGRGSCVGGASGNCSCTSSWSGPSCDFRDCPSNCSYNLIDENNEGAGLHGTCTNSDVYLRCYNQFTMPTLNISGIQEEVLDLRIHVASGTVFGNYSFDQILYAMSVDQVPYTTNCLEGSASNPNQVCQQIVPNVTFPAGCWYKRYKLSWCDCLEEEFAGASCESKFIPIVDDVNIWVGGATQPNLLFSVLLTLIASIIVFK
eukprot:c8518_g1_i3.p1 GENE.c8518_g1_i3~~c8518_g1_i3.p1  ORF type:complete len:282 (-),score=53.22 c8518_g1_i3:13-858(-)